MEKKAQLKILVFLILVLVILASLLVAFLFFKNHNEEDNRDNLLENLTRMEQLDDAVQHYINLTNNPPSCQDECSAKGLKKCFGSTGYKICGNFDSDPCYEWSSINYCGDNEECSSGRCKLINREEPSTPNPQDSFVRYDFDEVEILSVEQFNITKTEGGQLTWADILSGQTNNLEITHAVFNLRRGGEIMKDEEEYIKVKGTEGEKTFLYNSGGGFTEFGDGSKSTKKQFWSAKKLIGDDVIKDKTPPVYAVILWSTLDKMNKIVSAKLAFSDDGLNFNDWREDYFNWKITLEKNSSNEDLNKYGLSQRVCFENPKSGKIDYNCTCIINSQKDKLTIILRKDGIYNSPKLVTAIELYLNSVEENLGLRNIGISYFEGSSIEELDMFIDFLYFERDIGYLIYIGDEFDFTWAKDEFTSFNRFFELQNIGINEEDYFIPNEEGEGSIVNPSLLCQEVAISWIVPYLNYDSSQKVEFVERLLNKYSSYHKNVGGILKDYSSSILFIYDDEFSDEIEERNKGYGKEIVLVNNKNHSFVKAELKNKHYFFSPYIHGSPTTSGIGLNYEKDYNYGKGQIYITPQYFYEYFIDGDSTPFMMSEALGCGTEHISSEKGVIDSERCCWPQVLLDLEVWAYYNLFSNPLAQEKLGSGDSFLGEILKKEGINEIVFGDITAHFK
jgi:hypothetical protein